MTLDVSSLYDICQRLEENRDSADFQFCIDSIKNEDISVKKMAMQIVFRFFDDFPEKRAAALNTLMSQLKNPDIEVQKLVIKGLPSTCSRHEDYVDQVGDVLAQLLSIRDSQELLLVRKSLNAILEKYPKATILAMHKAVTKAESIEEKVVMLQFMDEKVIRINGELTPFMKRQITEIYCRMLISSTPDEIEVVLRFIGKSRQITEQEKQVAFKAALTCLVDEGVKQDQRNDIEECSEFNKLISNLVKVVLILRLVDRSYIMNRKMTNYLFSKFDKLHRFHSSDRKDIMKVLSGITYAGNYEGPQDCSNVIALFNFLKSRLPDPCSSDTNLEDVCIEQRNDEEWNVDFPEIELVSIVTYNILQKSPVIAQELLALGDIWKPRFQYLVSVIRVYTRCLKKRLDEAAGIKEKDRAKNLKLLKVANNIGLIANCFLVNICDLHAKILPSWVVQKRRAPSKLVSLDRKRRKRDFRHD